MNKIYYVIHKETQDAGGGYFELTGLKDIRLYKIENNELKFLNGLDLELSDNSEEEITDFLLEEGIFEYEIDFELIQL
jgi:hypothetical protein